ncbi:MAG: 1-acyl-sn-glycerol-3-phosphate acyltransferase [Bacteroidales bacterium]|nr:1-acyl-sn-glycerol-3-phosphate acyltransferase [Candidatus Physcousia equi]
MFKALCKKILMGWMGFKINVDQPHPQKYIIALAPHTSNWDFIIGILYSRSHGFRCDFMMKKAWFFWPMGYLMRALGGVPVERSKKMSLTDQLAQAAQKRNEFHLCITPEGTRKPVKEWKKGFYYIALKANLPILLYALDYEKKLITCTKTIIPNGNYEEQMAEIKEYFKDTRGKYPEKFCV